MTLTSTRSLKINFLEPIVVSLGLPKVPRLGELAMAAPAAVSTPLQFASLGYLEAH